IRFDPSDNEGTLPMNPVSVAVVGTGDWGANLVRNFGSLPGTRLAALCDSDGQRLARFATTHPHARRIEDPALVAADPDYQAVVIAASAVNHHVLAKMMLEAGKDVYVEKPLTLEVRHAEELVRLAAENKRILMVGHLLIYHPGVRYLKQLVQNGELGDLFYIYSQRVNLGKV